MTKEQNASQHFTHRLTGTGRITVELGANFTHEEWDPIEAFTRAQIEAGLVHWHLDLRKLHILTSLLIGAIIGLNMVLQSHHGTLRLLVERDSRVSRMIAMSKINRILAIDEI